VGVSGFVGSHVAAALLDRGYDVRGTLRRPDGPAGDWLRRELGVRGNLSLHAAELSDSEALREAMAGCTGLVMCAGAETQEPATVRLMVGAAEHCLGAARAEGVGRAVFTSSTGSTNPPQGEPERKNEREHWSDPDQQESMGKWSPAAKTRMEKRALELAADDLRVAIMLPSLILGPALSPEPSGGLRFLRRILVGERMAEGAPDGSMSIIDARDLAALHVAALEQPEARGRYFALAKSWHWQDILEALGRVHPAYEPPAWPADQARSSPTQFDFTRRDQLGVTLRGLDEILGGAVEDLRRRGMLPEAP
jgi:nucleoside-diphosphate-sugar epimerase